MFKRVTNLCFMPWFPFHQCYMTSTASDLAFLSIQDVNSVLTMFRVKEEGVCKNLDFPGKNPDFLGKIQIFKKQYKNDNFLLHSSCLPESQNTGI